ncbi:MAG: protein kinase [Candidatus Melainabacteria bacterium]|nr:protein kinase [Candidatus Melainabacteria bacterium]
MTQDEKCEKCGKNVRLNKAGTITQWLKSTSDCECENRLQLQALIDSDERLMVKCPKCGKVRTPEREGSLTQWIFKDARCKCEWDDLNFEFDPTQREVIHRPEPMDEEIKELLKSEEIDYHGLAPDEFPFERYLIASEIGRGASGPVFKCWDRFLKKRVAIKTLSGKVWSPEDMLRLQNEARASSKLNHPNVVRVLDFGASTGGQPFMVMDFVRGQTLQEVLKEQEILEQYIALSIFSQILSGVSHAHRQGVMHRDIKPANILVLNAMSEDPKAMVIDFGIAALTQVSSVSKTASGNTTLTGSPPYMSPDQARGEIFAATSDVYSMGCVFYETLTGINPFRGRTVLETINRHVSLKLPPFSETIPDEIIDPELEAIVARMLDKNPQMRYQSADEVLLAIDSVFDRIDAERGGSRLKNRRSSDDEQLFDDRLWKSGRPPDAMLYAIACGCLLLILSGGLLIMNRNAEEAISSKASLPKTKNTTTLNDDASKTSYIEDMLMPNSKKNDAYLKTLKPGQDLRNINLRMSDVTDAGVKSIQHLPINWLDLSYTSITNKALKYASRMPQLVGLYLTGTEVTADGIKHLKAVKTLQFLDVSAIPVNQECMRAIAEIPNLHKLFMISVPDLDVNVISELKAATHLDGLGFRRSILDRASIPVIGKFKNLQTLLLSYCGITDDDLPHLQSLTELHLLDLCGNEITDKGLMVLANFKQLKQLHIGNCTRITQAGIDRFKKKHKNCAVRMDLGPNMLGNNQE